MEPRRSRESERKGWKAAGALGRLAGPLSRLGRSPGPVFAELRRAPGTGRGSVLPQSLLAAPRAAPVDSQELQDAAAVLGTFPPNLVAKASRAGH